MKFILSIIMCWSINNICLSPHVFAVTYEDTYTCLLDGYMKSYEKTIEIGQEEINKHGIYLKFDCTELVLPEPKPKVMS